MESVGANDAAPESKPSISAVATGGSVKVKQEPREEIPKTADPDQGSALTDFAETTMNELLGWYGYDKVVDREDTQGLNLQRFTSRTSGRGSPSQRGDGDGEDDDGDDDVANRDSVSTGSCESELRANSAPSPGSGSEIAAHHQTLVTALTSNKSPTSSKSPSLPDSTAAVQNGCIVCAWCQKPGLKLFTLKTETGTKVFCSELCFTQCRRASFKKNKVCDWCKHVRHTVNYVDFQDGEQQLQFCSDKCLNQYKMNIFCKETQEHLQLIHTPQPAGGGVSGNVSTSSAAAAATAGGKHHNLGSLGGAVGKSGGGGAEGGGGGGGGGGGESGEGGAGYGSDGGSETNQILITPDLWMQNGDDEKVGIKRKRKSSSICTADDDEDDVEDHRHHQQQQHRASNCVSPVNEVVPAEKKPDISKMVLKTECGGSESTALAGRRISSGGGGGGGGADRHPTSASVAGDMGRRHFKIDSVTRERIRRVRSRDSNCTPLSVTTSPASSSQMSTPPNVTSTLTPPSVNGPMPPGGPLVGALPPGLLAPPGYFYPHLLAGGLPGMPPQAWMMPPHPGMNGPLPALPPPPPPPPIPPSSSGAESVGRHSVATRGAAPQESTGVSRSSASSVAGQPTATTPTPSSSGSQPQGSPAKPAMPNFGFPYPMGALPGGVPPGLPFPPPPPGLHAAMLPPHPTLPGGPPVTVMVPYPVLLPVPVPIPIPVPIRCDKDLRHLALVMNSAAKPARSTSAPVGPSAAAGTARPASVPPNKVAQHQPVAVSHCLGPKRRCRTDEEKENSESAANCEGSSRDKIACACCQLSDVPVPRNGDLPGSGDGNSCKTFNGISPASVSYRRSGRSSLKSPEPRMDSGIAAGGGESGPENGSGNVAMLSTEDVAIDLSKDKSRSDSPSGSVAMAAGCGGKSLPPPATITVKTESPAPPLIISPLQAVGGFLMPPRDHAYSSRRSMILDAPSVPRDRNKSPSPEKRLMLRSPNRDVMFAKRRCMRTRIKTK